MEGFVFLGSFLAVIVGIAVVVTVLRNKIRRFSNRVFGKSDILQALSEIDSVADDAPRSLNGCDALLIPQILRDFPDFDASLAKTYVRDYLKEKLRNKAELTIYNVVIARYLSSSVQKTIVFQAAVSYREDGAKKQTRYELHYSHILTSAADSVAANCPNCGGALGYGVTVCPYCDSRVANVLGNTWQFTEMLET